MILLQTVRRRLLWTAIVTVLALVLYPISLGPTSYVLFRDATPRVPFAAIYHAFYAPLWAAANRVGFAGPLWDYQNYCVLLAAHHDGRDVGVTIIPPEPRDGVPLEGSPVP